MRNTLFEMKKLHDDVIFENEDIYEYLTNSTKNKNINEHNANNNQEKAEEVDLKHIKYERKKQQILKTF